MCLKAGRVSTRNCVWCAAGASRPFFPFLSLFFSLSLPPFFPQQFPFLPIPFPSFPCLPSFSVFLPVVRHQPISPFHSFPHFNAFSYLFSPCILPFRPSFAPFFLRPFPSLPAFPSLLPEASSFIPLLPFHSRFSCHPSCPRSVPPSSL